MCTFNRVTIKILVGQVISRCATYTPENIVDVFQHYAHTFGKFKFPALTISHIPLLVYSLCVVKLHVLEFFKNVLVVVISPIFIVPCNVSPLPSLCTSALSLLLPAPALYCCLPLADIYPEHIV